MLRPRPKAGRGLRLSKKPVGPRVEKILKNRPLLFSSRKVSCTLKKMKHFKSRKTARLCGFCAFCLLLGGSTIVRHRLAKYKIQLVFLAVCQRVGLYNLLPLYLFDTLKPRPKAGRGLFVCRIQPFFSRSLYRRMYSLALLPQLMSQSSARFTSTFQPSEW